MSLFDYRNISEAELNTSLDACCPFQADRNCDWELSILFLTPAAYGRLLSGPDWRREAARTGMVVPHAEACHPGQIPFADIEEQVDLYLDHTPSAFEQARGQVRESLHLPPS